MAHKINKWVAATNPATVHDSLESAVTAELAQMLGHKSGGESQVPPLARDIVENADAFIACLKQLGSLQTAQGPTMRGKK